LKTKGFNMLLSVSQGSVNDPYVAILEYNGNKKKKSVDVALVGKGVTFDSGGISIKPSNGMWDMKQDMAGAAAVVGALKAVALQKLPVNIIGAVGLVENMPSGTATRPGDIVKSMSGQTVEILNTDAEGRLVLADLLWYVQDIYGVKKVIDIATLTGAVTVALGTEMAGLMGNSQKLIDQIKKAGQTVGEEVWQLPLNKAYDKMMDSDIADMKNISESRNAGTITAACFLQRFIKKDTAWAHLDIGGMDKETKGKLLTPKGATGFGVRLFDQIIKDL
ncbi:MAG: leucyl aminopeptidase, partial [Alphaproteobacteria bacterium]|nr:leucyl aminopeptidase [Alphaproteobacteria bacterium]